MPARNACIMKDLSSWNIKSCNLLVSIPEPNPMMRYMILVFQMMFSPPVFTLTTYAWWIDLIASDLNSGLFHFSLRRVILNPDHNTAQKHIAICNWMMSE